MKNRVHNTPQLIFSTGTQVVSLKRIEASNGQTAHPPGAVGVVVNSPSDRQHPYRIRFVDGFEAVVRHDSLMLLAEYKQGLLNDSSKTLATGNLYDRIIYRCIVGSRAFGLETETSDTDRRGIYLPPAKLQWSLYGVPEQLENDEAQETYWELQKFLVMALKGNPNILECLYSPMIEHVTPLGQELLDMREAFLSRLVYQTFNGYVMSQFKRMRIAMKNQGKIKPKHLMHLIRLLISGIHVLREGSVALDVGPHREQLLAIKTGELGWKDVESWRRALHIEFDHALAETNLPERPDYERANDFLVRARQLAIERGLP